jgi:hypothetical protein
VTNGAVPIHAYSTYNIVPNGAGGYCLQPGTDVTSAYTIATAGGHLSPSGSPIILIGDHSPQNMGGFTTVTVVGTVPATGRLYVTIHLEYGLKRTSGWTKLGENAVGSGPYAGITINEPQTYTLSFTGGSTGDTQTTQSINEFKRPAGFLGFAEDQLGPKKGARVQVYSPTGSLLGTVYTDEDGYYLFEYKHKAKAATYTVKLPDYKLQQSATVKANGFAVVNFTIP